MKYLGYIGWAVTLVVLIWFVCSMKYCGGKLKQGKTDTLRVETIKYIKGDPIIIEKENTSPKSSFTKKYITTSDFNKMLDSLRYYEEKYQIDSSGYAIVKDSVYGKKTWSKFEYFGQPYIKLVERNTTIERTDTLFVENKKVHMYLTGEAGGNLTRFDYSVGASLATRKNLMLGYRYGLNTKTHNIGLGLKLF